MKLSKEEFIQYFNPIVKFIEKNDEVLEALEKIFTSVSIMTPEYSDRLLDDYIDLLQVMCEDKFEWVSYFIWECDLGKEPKEIEIENKKYLLNSVEMLYEILLKSK